MLFSDDENIYMYKVMSVDDGCHCMDICICRVIYSCIHGQVQVLMNVDGINP